MANDSNIKVMLENVGYQKAVDILVFGINNIEYVEVEPVSNYNIVINNNLVYPSGFRDGGKIINIDYIKNTTDECEYVFEEEIADYNYTDNSGEIVTLFSIGHIMITKLKIPKKTDNTQDVIGIPFLLKVGYLDENGVKKSKLIYFSIRIPYNTIASKMELPLYYRPFYFNSVLLLTPQNMTPDYYYDIKNLHKNKRKDDVETTTTERSDIYQYRIYPSKGGDSNIKNRSVIGGDLVVQPPSTDKGTGQNFNPIVDFKEGASNFEEGGDSLIDKGGATINVPSEFRNYSLIKIGGEKFNELLKFIKRGENDTLGDIQIGFKYAKNFEGFLDVIKIKFLDNEGNAIKIEGKENFELTRNDNTNIWFGEIDYSGPNKPRNIIIEVEKEKEGNSDYFICKLYCIKKDYEEITNPNENCYGRLFYSIANGCSLRNDLGDKNIYELNNVTLSYVNGNKHGNMVLKKPFRCFSEMVGSENGRVKSIKGADKLTREMMYGITEPLRLKKMSGGESEITEKVYITSENGSEKKTITLNVYNPQSKGTGGSEIVYGTWKHKKHNGGLVDATATNYKIEWISTYNKWREFDVNGVESKNGAKLRRYNNSIIITGDDGTKDTIEIYPRRTSTSVVYVVEDEKKENIIRVWHIDYTLHSAKTGKATLTVWGEYTDTYNIEEKITREGFPCINIIDNNGGIGDELYIDKFRNESTGVIPKNYDIDLYNVYTDGVTIKVNDNGTEYSINSPIDVLQKYKMEYNKYNDNEKIKPLIFDTSQWLDISFSVTEGHPEDEVVFSQEFVGFNDVKFYDDIYWGKIKYMDDNGKEQEGYEGVHVKGYSSSNIRYFALGRFGKDDRPTSDNGTSATNCGNEIKRFLESLYNISAKDSDKQEKNEGVNIVKYGGVNINDYLFIKDEHPGYPYTKNSGWKSIHTMFGTNKDNLYVWLSGKAGSTANYQCIDVTNILSSLYRNPNQAISKKFECSEERNYIIGVCDNYTNLDNESYRKEDGEMYSIIKPHTSRFAVIRLYTLDYDNEEK